MPSWTKQTNQKKSASFGLKIYGYIFFHFIFLSVGVLPECFSVYHIHAVLEEASGGHLDTLELALAVLSSLMGARE